MNNSISNQVGQTLTQLRHLSGLSQAELAERAQISRVTLSRWENGKQKPRFVEIQSVLKALNATPEQTEQIALITGGGQLHKRQEIQNASFGPRPHGGELLQALRARNHLSIDDVAQKINVTPRTLRRWEKAEVWPSTEGLHALCFALEANVEEMKALTDRDVHLNFIDGVMEEPISLFDLEERLRYLHWFSSDPEVQALKDLEFLSLEAKAWRSALKSENSRLFLSDIYSCHVNYCCTGRRWEEGFRYASRSLDLLKKDEKTRWSAVQSALALARCSTFRFKKPKPESGLEILQHWIDAPVHVALASWLLADLAKYYFMSGFSSQALTTVKKSRQALDETDYEYDRWLREYDEAEITLACGNASDAMELIERERKNLQVGHVIDFQLLEADAALKLNMTARASECAQSAQDSVQKWSLNYHQTELEKIIRQF